MSRIGKMPIELPNTVKAEMTGSNIDISGPMGNMKWDIPNGISIDIQENVMTVSRESDLKEIRSLHGLTRALVSNMVTGVSSGFEKQLEIIGVGYKAALNGKDIDLAIGFSHPVFIPCPDGITFEVPQPTRIIIKGIDKQQVGEVAANIRGIRKPEPYKGKGIKYSDEVIRRKAGKASKK